ncbi:hypothetical protein INH39_25060 [Massilia violaceinigra]|uniref:Uncharacterized protein n=1 Tax=Massilia violaceinigra TaxID=2045208 RepID=A0ABY4A1R1_9BURK|nr:hypothetical protein [Massilia violaceinigra]UOD28682.1 hypothetical protein INH39_25060 [Massilia violaceinigra]
MSPAKDNRNAAECRSVLAGGALLTVSATVRPRAGRADVKCSGAGDAALAERMQQVVRLARLTEGRFDSRDQVVISIDRAPGRHERDWELAVVLADRMVRGVWQPAGPVVANGWSEEWQLGRIGGHDVVNAPAHALLGGPGGLGWLGALTGQPDSAPSVASARAWFPLHSGGINDSLCWVEVNVYPLAAAGMDEEETIAAPGLDPVQLLAVRQALAGARHFDGRALGRWRTVVRFGQARFQGNSFELALVMADRMARGREFVARGRVIASGCSGAWHAGRVDTVEGCAPKCALILQQSVAGDRILLPRAWEGALAPGFAEALRERGASVALVERIGII